LRNQWQPNFILNRRGQDRGSKILLISHDQ
jgi:hypothetical protein